MNAKEFGKKLTGVITPIVTPFKENYELNLDGFKPNIDYMVENGVRVVIPCGSTGEFPSMTVEERKQVVEAVVVAADGRIPVLAGVSDTNVWTVIDQAQHAKAVGADGAMLVAPYYFKPTEEEIFDFFQRINDAVDFPLVFYNNPGTTKVNTSLNFLERLGKLENVAAIKETNSQPVRYYAEISRFGEDLPVVPAGEPMAVFNMLTGAPGFMTVASNFAPALMRDMFDAASSKQVDRAFELYSILNVYRSLFEHMVVDGIPAYITYGKAAVEMIGLHGGPARPPLTTPSDGEKAKIRKVLEEKMGLKCVA